MLLEDKIARLASYIFILFLLGMSIYLFFTQIWFVYLLASFNIISVFGFTFVFIKKFYKEKNHN
jgi:hypothetical protein